MKVKFDAAEHPTYEAAQKYNQAGLSCIPFDPKSKEPYYDLLPKGADGKGEWKPYQTRHPEASERWTWFGEHGDDVNIACICGQISGGEDGLSHCVIDFDSREKYGAWAKEHKDLVNTTPVVRTSRGYHVHVRVRTPPVGNVAFYIDGSDEKAGEIRTEGGCAILPPSIHPDTGKPYELVSGDWDQIAVIDDIDVQTEKQRKAESGQIDKWLVEALKGVREGERNDTAHRLASYWKGLGIPDDVILQQLRAWNELNSPPLADKDLVTVAQSVAKYPVKGKKQSQAELMVELALQQDVTLFIDDGDEPHAHFAVAGHREIAALDSRRFAWWLRGLLFRHHNKPGYHEAIKAAVGVLSAKAAFDHPTHHTLWNRVAWGPDGALWYDLADPSWQAVRIDQQGWKIVRDPPVLFQRFAHQQAQVIPEPVSSDEAAEVLARLWQFVNIKLCEDDTKEPDYRLLYLGYIGTTLIPDIPHPIPITAAVQGAGKTVMARATRELVDPSDAGLLSFSRDGSELIQALSHHWCAYFDNVSSIPGWIQDILCRAATGEGFSKRKLWTDDEDVIYTFRRCVALNGINVSASRGDLFDRSILFQLDRLKGDSRQTEHELWPAFDEARPRLLGAIFTTLSGAISQDEETANALGRAFRMADFASWGYRFCEALGQGMGHAFINAYALSIGKRSIVALEAHPLGQAVKVFMANCKSGTWEGSPAELLKELEAVAKDEKIDMTVREWPGSASWLGRRLREVTVDLEEVGIAVRDEHDGSQRIIYLTAS